MGLGRFRTIITHIIDAALVLVFLQSIKEHDTGSAAISGLYVGYIIHSYLSRWFYRDDDDKGHDSTPEEPPDDDGGLALSVRHQINEILLATEKPVKV